MEALMREGMRCCLKDRFRKASSLVVVVDLASIMLECKDGGVVDLEIRLLAIRTPDDMPILPEIF
jgi:hypothetical protein